MAKVGARFRVCRGGGGSCDAFRGSCPGASHLKRFVQGKDT